MINLPTTVVEIDKLISDGVQEDLHLDYKESPALDKGKKHEIVKDVSAFANSDGGTLIYGVIERDNLPIGRDSGVDHNKFSREQLEQIISSNITPRIEGIKIVPIAISATNSIFVIEIPKSYRAPHQSADKKYYKRFNFLSVPMEDYEINDVRNRQITVSPLINVDAEILHGVAAYITVSNIGTLPALEVTFSFSKKLGWLNKTEDPVLFRRGVKQFPPQKKHSYLYNIYGEIFKDGSESPSEFDVTVSYIHPQVGYRISDTFHIDLRDYDEALAVEPELYELGKTIKDSIKSLTDEIKKLNNGIEAIKNISGDTGLNLSITTLRNLRKINSKKEEFEKIDPENKSYKVFKELLKIDRGLALKLQSYFRFYNPETRLEDLEGMTTEIIIKLRKHFIIK